MDMQTKAAPGQGAANINNCTGMQVDSTIPPELLEVAPRREGGKRSKLVHIYFDLPRGAFKKALRELGIPVSRSIANLSNAEYLKVIRLLLRRYGLKHKSPPSVESRADDTSRSTEGGFSSAADDGHGERAPEQQEQAETQPEATTGAVKHPLDFGLELRSGAIPDELKAVVPWSTWCAKPKDGHPGEFQKPPCNMGGFSISLKDPANRLSFDAAVEVHKQHPATTNGIGFVLDDPELGIVVLDIDAKHILTAEQQALVGRITEQTYSEWSPSDNGGLRIILYGRILKDYTSPFEIYGGHALRFLTTTGHKLEGSPDKLADCQPELDALLATFDQKAAEPPGAATGQPEMVGLDGIGLGSRLRRVTGLTQHHGDRRKPSRFHG